MPQRPIASGNRNPTRINETQFVWDDKEYKNIPIKGTVDGESLLTVTDFRLFEIVAMYVFGGNAGALVYNFGLSVYSDQFNTNNRQPSLLYSQTYGEFGAGAWYLTAAQGLVPGVSYDAGTPGTALAAFSNSLTSGSFSLPSNMVFQRGTTIRVGLPVSTALIVNDYTVNGGNMLIRGVK